MRSTRHRTTGRASTGRCSVRDAESNCSGTRRPAPLSGFDYEGFPATAVRRTRLRKCPRSLQAETQRIRGRGSQARTLFLSATRRKWLLTTFALGRTNYWLSVADASSAPFFLAWEIWVRHSPLEDVALAGAAGYMLWGLSEYAF